MLESMHKDSLNRKPGERGGQSKRVYFERIFLSRKPDEVENLTRR
jgi:hypothetical protein